MRNQVRRMHKAGVFSCAMYSVLVFLCARVFVCNVQCAENELSPEWAL